MTEPKYELRPLGLFNGSISADNGQGMAATQTCTKFSCQEWQDGVAVGPVLVGGVICPRCSTSYGHANADALAGRHTT